jgi:hypothetical protein
MHWLICLGSAPPLSLYKRPTGAWRVHNFFVIHQGESSHVCDFC